MRQNFLQDTLTAIEQAGKTLDDFRWAGNHEGSLSLGWGGFKDLADFEYGYDAGVCKDLVIVFHDGSWLERAEYDGATWWMYKRTPVLQASVSTYTRIEDGYNDDFEESIGYIGDDAHPYARTNAHSLAYANFRKDLLHNE